MVSPASRVAYPQGVFELRQVYRSYGRVVALDAVELCIASGRTTALIGPSGAGKSSVLRMLVGLDWPDSGEVRFDGEPLQRERLLQQRRRIGYMIQEGGLFPHLSAAANIALLARTVGWSAERIAQRIEVLAAMTRLPVDALRRYPAELSGGQRQRVGLIRALMLDPQVLLLDEPLGALDPIIRHELQEQMRELFVELRKTVVLVTHDVAEAAYLADTLVLMRAGSIAQQGTARELHDAPDEPFVTRFMTAQRSLEQSL